MENMDYKKKIVKYLKKNLSKGYTQDSLKWSLINQGYSRAIIEKAIEQTSQELAEVAPILKEKPVIKHQIIDENNRPITIKKPFWKRFFTIF